MNTDETESKIDIILKTLEKAINQLNSKYGKIENNWKLGDHHQLALLGEPLIMSILGGNEPQSWPIHGSGRVLNNAPTINLKLNTGPINFDASQYVFAGPSWRQIVDFSNVDEAIGILPGGISGNPLNPHFQDQVKMWVDGNYKVLKFHDTTGQWLDNEIIATQEWYNWDYN